MTPRDRQSDKPEQRSLGDLLGDQEWLAEHDRRERERRAQWAAEGAEQRAQWAADDPGLISSLTDLAESKRCTVDDLLEEYRSIIGLARLADEDPAKVIAQLEKGACSAKLLRGIFGFPHPKRGPKTGRAEPERWRVVHELRSLGYAGKDLDGAITQVAGRNVEPATYRRSADRFKGNEVAALNLDTPAIRRARSMPLLPPGTGE